MFTLSVPEWLNNYLVNDLNAVNAPDFDKARSNLANSHADNCKYLGTYFPRTYTELVNIMKQLEKETTITETGEFKNRKTVRILSVGCGTGADVTGLIDYLSKNTAATNFSVSLVDGNSDALGLCRKILEMQGLAEEINITINQTVNEEISCESDFLRIAGKLTHYGKFDFIITSKFLNELIGKIPNPYSNFVNSFASGLNSRGLMILLDTSNPPKGSSKWIPEIMNNEINQNADKNSLATILPVPCHGNGCRFVDCYTQFPNYYYKLKTGAGCVTPDRSKYTFRIISKKELYGSLEYKNSYHRGGYIVNSAKQTSCPKGL